MNERGHDDSSSLDTNSSSKRNLRLFIGWDGEGYNAYSVDSNGIAVAKHRYMLFGCSAGYYESSIDLRTVTCLELILYVEKQNPNCFHVGFSFEYDVNMILRDLSWRHLAMLHDIGVVKWRGYRIKHIPHKMLSISKGGISATIYDVFGFFHTSYLVALRKFGIGTEQQVSHIEVGKNNRSRFTYSEIKAVTDYWSVEISLLPSLMNSLRKSCYDAGFFITQWHGPGALASFAIKQHKLSGYRPNKNIPALARNASRFAYAGGRFQAWRCGLYLHDIYTADINSAYAYAASMLPRLDIGKWEHTKDPQVRSPRDIRHFALYRISFDASEMESKARSASIPFPLFHRSKEGNLTWPAQTEGWYWAPEAALVAGSKYAVFHESWVFSDNGERPFAFVRDAFERRLHLQAMGHPAEKAYKWFLAAIYGQLAQRVGWNRDTRKAPSSHCLEWAGYITSYCRAFVYRAAIDVAKRGGLISIDTDGVTSTVPFTEDRLPNGVGRQLGEWKLENYSGILHWQNGIYWLRNSDGSWEKPKTRGIPRKHLTFNDASDALDDFEHGRGNTNPRISVSRNRFIGYRQAMQHQFDEWRKWVSEDVEVEFGGTGKGRHVSALCPACIQNRSSQSTTCSGDSLHTIVHFPPDHVDSYPHKLPWLTPPPDKEQHVTELGIWEEQSQNGALSERNDIALQAS